MNALIGDVVHGGFPLTFHNQSEQLFLSLQEDI
jgi:hypothetical protein